MKKVKVKKMNPFEEFKGKIGRTHKESTPWWPEPKGLGKDYPNIIVILLDDTGFSQFGCYGSTIETPNFDRLAGNGLNKFEMNHTITNLLVPGPQALTVSRTTVRLRPCSGAIREAPARER